MTGDRAGRVFGPVLLTTCRVYDGAPLLDGARVRDAEGRGYGALVFGRGRWALVIGWRGAPVPAPARWRPRFLWARARRALLLAVLRLINAMLVRVGLAVIVLPGPTTAAARQGVVFHEAAFHGPAFHFDPARTPDEVHGLIARRVRVADTRRAGRGPLA